MRPSPEPTAADVGDDTDTLSLVVHEEGLEPPRLAAPEPKSGASANSATRARGRNLVGDLRVLKGGALAPGFLAEFGADRFLHILPRNTF